MHHFLRSPGGAAETGDGKQKKKKKKKKNLTKTAAVPTAADPDTVPQTVPTVSGEPLPIPADEEAAWDEEMKANDIAEAKQLKAMRQPSGPQKPKERLWDGTDDGEEPLMATREKPRCWSRVTLNAYFLAYMQWKSDTFLIRRRLSYSDNEGRRLDGLHRIARER